jgi:hypothetical protein
MKFWSVSSVRFRRQVMGEKGFCGQVIPVPRTRNAK